MNKLSKRLLAISLTAFFVGFVSVCGGDLIPVSLSVGMPTGAIFLGLFLVAYILQGEMAKFDAEEQSRLALAQRYAEAPSERRPAAAPKRVGVTLVASSR
jgi:hypothetical protein